MVPSESDIDADQTARELLRAIRGDISQVAFSRLLGFRGNAIAAWEGGHRFPTVHETLRAAEKRRLPVARSFEVFHPRTAALADPTDLSGWLRALVGSSNNREIAARSGYSEHRVGRWLRGAAEPRLPQFLVLLQALTGRCSDWVAALVPIEGVPSLCESYRARQRIRRLVFQEPWTAAIVPLLAVLRPHTRPALPIAQTLGIGEAEVAEVLDALTDAGVVSATEEGYRMVAPLTVDTVPTPGETNALRRHWSGVSHARLTAPRAADRFQYNVFNVSRADLERVHGLLASTFREIRGIVAASEPAEETVLYVAHLFAFTDGDP